MERVRASHRVTKANKDMAGTIVWSDFDATDYTPLQPSKSIVKPPSVMRIEIEQTMTDLRVVMKTDFNAIIKNGPTKLTNSLELQIVEAVGSMFEDPSQTSYFHSNNILKSNRFIVVEPVLGKVFQPGRAPTESEVYIRSLVQMQTVADTIIRSMLYTTGFIVPIAETFGNMVERQADEYGPRTWKVY